MLEDKELVAQYAATRSEAAFSELVQRHLKMVYGTALRQVNGDSHLAEDVAQTVFVDLARKAANLQPAGTLAGWLHASARFAAANAIRSEVRRKVREHTSAAMNEINPSPTASWNELRPIIDEVMGKLSEPDREAIVLRYFESLEFSRVGQALGVGESGARMRVERALEKLRALLQQRGLTTTNTALVGALAESSALSMPTHLAAGIIHAALAQAATTASTSTATSTLLKIIAMKKIALIAIGVIAVSVGTVVSVKSFYKPQHGPSGVVRVTAQFQATLTSGDTLVTGGGQIQPGKRVFVFITPLWLDAAGNPKNAPTAKPQLSIEARFVEGSEADLAKLGLKPPSVEKNNSTPVKTYSDAQFAALLAALKKNTRADVLSVPHIVTLVGQQCRIASQSSEKINGKVVPLGPLLDLTASVSSDGVSIDLTGLAEIAEPISR